MNAIVESPTQPSSDLPVSVGKATTRALATAGLTTLDQITTCTKTELLSLHGGGPKVVRILADTLTEKACPYAEARQTAVEP